MQEQVAVYSTGRSVRLGCRNGEIVGCTAGLAPGYVQANLIVIPEDYAHEFKDYCSKNPQPCPLLAVTLPGDRTTELAQNCDITTDLPQYIVHKGKEEWSQNNIVEEWQSDSVGFLMGCSFSFEEALIKEGIPVRHIEEGKTVPMYVTNRETIPSGRFHGRLVVSMRPMHPSLVKKAEEVTERFGQQHGGPIHKGDPSELGIADINSPDFGNGVEIHPEEIPVFWACGVTTQIAVSNAAPSYWMSHAPGCMFVTDLN